MEKASSHCNDTSRRISALKSPAVKASLRFVVSLFEGDVPKENAVSRGDHLKIMSGILVQPLPSEGFHGSLCDTLSRRVEGHESLHRGERQAYMVTKYACSQ